MKNGICITAKIKREVSWRTPAGYTILNLILFFGRLWQFDIDLFDSVFINSLYAEKDIVISDDYFIFFRQVVKLFKAVATDCVIVV